MASKFSTKEQLKSILDNYLASSQSLMIISTRDDETRSKKYLKFLLCNHFGCSQEYISFNEENDNCNTNSPYRILVIDDRRNILSIKEKYSNCGRKIVAIIPWAEDSEATRIDEKCGDSCCIVREIINAANWLDWTKDDKLNPFITEFVEKYGDKVIGKGGITTRRWNMISAELDNGHSCDFELHQPGNDPDTTKLFSEFLNKKGYQPQNNEED